METSRIGGNHRRRRRRALTTGSVKDDLQTIPGIGPSMAIDLRDLGLARVSDVKGQDPEEMYERLCAMRGQQLDRCVLYVFRCAVSFAGRKTHDPERLKWWNWTDARLQDR